MLKQVQHDIFRCFPHCDAAPKGGGVGGGCLHFQINSHRFNLFKNLRRNAIEKIPVEIGEDMCGRTSSQNLSVSLIKDSIVKDQFCHLCPLHCRLDDE